MRGLFTGTGGFVANGWTAIRVFLMRGLSGRKRVCDRTNGYRATACQWLNERSLCE